MKKITLCFFTITILLIFSSVSAYAGEINSDSTQVHHHDLSEYVIPEGESIVIDAGNGMVVRVGHLPEVTIEPYLNTTKTLDLVTDEWEELCDDVPFLPETWVRVTNLYQNDGDIDILFDSEYFQGMDNQYDGLAPNYYIDFYADFNEYEVFVRASDEDGSYRIKANDYVLWNK